MMILLMLMCILEASPFLDECTLAKEDPLVSPYLEIPDFLDDYTRGEILRLAGEQCPLEHPKNPERDTARAVDLSLPPAQLYLVQETVGRASWELRKFFKVQRELYLFHVNLRRWGEGTKMNLHSDVRYDPGSTRERLGMMHPSRGNSHACMVYLNQDFEGGELYFQEHFEHGRKVTLPIKEGSLVCFPCTAEGWHGVNRVRKGTRFVLSMWFTEDPGWSYWMLHGKEESRRRVEYSILTHQKCRGV